ncbi:MAG: rRNA maturation RNase YbeY [Paludibacter sp.]|nr:rRNA maturation RNase YbeY [Paludibacter sp.]
MINYISENINFQINNQNEISLWLQRTAAVYQKKIGTINYIFCSDKIILNINNQYLNHNFYTDIITFDYSIETIISGDIYISIDTVKRNAQCYHTQFEDEFHRVIVHGLLHLTGQNDKTKIEQTQMTAKENAALEMLKNTQNE